MCLVSLHFQDFSGCSSAGLCRGCSPLPAWRRDLNPLLYPHICLGELLLRLQAVNAVVGGDWQAQGAGVPCPGCSVSVTRWVGSDTGLAAALWDWALCVCSFGALPASLFLWDFGAWISLLCDVQLVKREARHRWYYWLTSLIHSTDYIQGKKTKPNKPWALAGFNE